MLDAGGVVDDTARPQFDAAQAHDVYQTLLQSVMSSRAPDDVYAKLQADAAALDPAAGLLMHGHT